MEVAGCRSRGGRRRPCVIKTPLLTRIHCPATKPYMLKRRVVIMLTLLDGVLFRTKKFIPDYRYTLNFVDLAAADEVVCIHLGGDWNEFRKAVCRIADVAITPLTVGGGIRTIERFDQLFDELPAEKGILGRGGWHIAADCGQRWGKQSVVCGYTHGRDPIPDIEPFGEILLQSVERDGSLEGYDLGLLADWLGVDCPVVVGSGCGTWSHMRDAFDAGADGCATTNIFHFTESALAACKSHLHGKGIEVRV